MLLAFAPFIAFAVIDRLVGPMEGMFAGFAVSSALLIRDWSQGRGPKVLEIGTAVLFGALNLIVAVWGAARGESLVDVLAALLRVVPLIGMGLVARWLYVRNPDNQADKLGGTPH